MIVIAGPCVIESGPEALKLAKELQKIGDRLGLDIIFKASFDKANRTSLDAYRGPGIEAGLSILATIKRTTGMRILTDIHLPSQAEAAAKAADIIQIPAFLCRQTDLLVAAARTGKIVSVKKGQFLSPQDMENVIGKLKRSECKDIWLTERGTFFGYGNLVNDMTAIPVMQKLGVPVIFDATHSVQKPGGLGNKSGGNREFVEPLAKAATAIGADGLFFEVHAEPDKALSDGPNMVKLEDFETMMAKIMAIKKVL